MAEDFTNPYQAPGAIDNPPTSVAEEYEVASWWRRLLNYILDLVFFPFGLGFTIGLVNAFAESEFLDTFFEGNAYLLVLPFYYIVFEGIFARTPAKWITRTKVVTLEGGKPKIHYILLRTLCRFVPFDAFSFLEANPIGWHDSWAKTKVVMKKRS